MSGVLAGIADIAISDSGLAGDATEFVRDAATRLLFDLHDACSCGRRCRRSG
jgi:hypothetical protein